MREGHRFPELVPLLVEGTTERYGRPLAAYLEARKAAGEVRDIDALQVAAMVMDLILAEVGRSVFTDAPIAALNVEVSAERIAALVLRGISAETDYPGRRGPESGNIENHIGKS